MKSNTVLFVFCCLLLGLSFANRSVLVLPSGEKCIAGQVLLKLDAGMSRRVRLAGSRFGIRELDDFCQREGISGIERLVRQPNPEPALRATGLDRLFLLSFGPDADIHNLVRECEKLSGVEGAWPNAVFAEYGQGVAVPDDDRYGEQWHLPRIHAPQAWESAHGDSSVIPAVIDDGLYYPHEDIAANVWVNSTEDINGNGRFDSLWYPDGDLDGVDQDGNGFSDDVIGYDFVGGDPIPMPESTDEHGTACWGVANAVTDNGIGIAAPPWNCRAMALRSGGGGYINMGAVIAAIGYGLDKGTWVFSMSFGTSNPYPPLDDACQAIWQSGAMSVAAAGGDGRLPTYPAAYENVIAVAASDKDDRKAAFSAWGDWIDICAPGVDILTTTPHGFEFYDGESVAAPIVAGVLAWFKSAYPDITNDSALALLYNYCDSMPDSLYRVGLLGHGRVAMTDSAVGGEAEPPASGVAGFRPRAAVVRGVLLLAEGPGASPLLDTSGREVLDLKPGANDVSKLAPGVYFVRSESSAVSRQPSAVTKVVVTR